MNNPITPELANAIAAHLDGVCSRLLSVIQLADDAISGSTDKDAALDLIAGVAESAGRVLDACTEKLGGSPTGNFDVSFDTRRADDAEG